MSMCSSVLGIEVKLNYVTTEDVKAKIETQSMPVVNFDWLSNYSTQ